VIAGRKRKVGVVRFPSGQPHREPKEVSAEVMAVRERVLQSEGINPSEALNALASFTLGKLLLRYRADKGDPGSISQVQYDAGQQWLGLVCRYAALNGFKHSITSPGFAMVGGGRSVAAEPDEDQVKKIKAEWKAAHDALHEASKVNRTLRIHEVTRGVVVDNWPVAWLSTDDYGHLRAGLNALVRVFKMKA
jgi:hypothetical protein